MPWAWKVHLKKPDGTPIKIAVGIKNKREVPGCLVDWMDSKGYIHHTLSPVYVSGKRKGMPKNSIYGCFTEETGWQPNAKDDDEADELRKAHNRKNRTRFRIKRPRTIKINMKVRKTDMNDLLSGRKGQAKPKKVRILRSSEALRRANESDAEYTRQMDRIDEEMKANINDW